MKKLAFLFAFCAVCFGARAERVGIPVSVSATGIVANAALVMNAAQSATNWVSLHGLYATVPAHSAATITLSTFIGGGTCTLYSFPLYNGGATASVQYVVPRKAVWPDANPQVDYFSLIGENGTNATVSVTQSVISTNTWSFTLLIEQ